MSYTGERIKETTITTGTGTLTLAGAVTGFQSFAAGVNFLDAVICHNYVGNLGEVALEALSPSISQTYVVSAVDGDGTLNPGALAIAAGDVVQYDGAAWQKVVSNSGGFPPSGARLLVVRSGSPVAPILVTDCSKIATFDGTSLTPSSLVLPAQQRSATLIAGNPGDTNPTNHLELAEYDEFIDNATVGLDRIWRLDGNTRREVQYSIKHDAVGDWEVGVGGLLVDGAGVHTISRDTVLDSSNNGAAVNFAAGIKEVFLGASGVLDGAQIGWKLRQTVTFSTTAGNDLATFWNSSDSRRNDANAYWMTHQFHNGQTGPNPERITIPTGLGGLYYTNVCIRWGANTANPRGITIIHYDSGDNLLESQLAFYGPANGSPYVVIYQAQWVLEMRDGDYLTIVLTSPGGISIVSSETRWIGYRIGPKR